MLTVNCIDDNWYSVKLENCDIEEFKTYVKLLDKIKNKHFDLGNGLWVMNKNDALSLKDIDKLNAIGSNMKLEPYLYQKQAVLFGMRTKNALFKLPCGAGKTPIGIAIISELLKANAIDGVSVIVVKATLKTQWQGEVEKFTNLRSNIIQTYAQSTFSDKTKLKRREIKLKTLLKDAANNVDEIITVKQEIENINAEIEKNFESQFDESKYDILILNYETLADDKVREYMLKNVDISLFFVDEIDMIKESSSHRNKNLCKFSQKAKYRFGATATPVRKNPRDIYSIFKFLSPGLFTTLKDFDYQFVTMNRFNRPSGVKNEAYLNKTISPLIFSKTLDEIADELPRQSVHKVMCSLTNEQIVMNETIQEEISAIKDKQTKLLNAFGPVKCKTNEEYISNENAIIARQTFAQMLANSEELLINSKSSMAKKYVTGSKSSKVELCLSMVEKIVNSGEKVCIFSKFLGIQDILARELTKILPNTKVDRIYGSLSDPERARIMNEYNSNDDHGVLLLSDAGESGLNLSSTKYIIEFELADSAAKQTQRHGRNRRADSTHSNVFVYQLIAKDSYDEIAQKIIDKKETFEKNILAGL